MRVTSQMATKSRDVLHGREESEVAEDLHEVVESDEGSAPW